MRQFLAALVILFATPVAAEDWHPVDGSEIYALLSERTVDYSGAWQEFRASGRTLYNAGAGSWGIWGVRGDFYCSQWPPNSAWDCYFVDPNTDGTAVRFSGSGDDITIGIFRGGN